MPKENLLDNQKYYLLPNGKQTKDITDFVGFNDGNYIKYLGRAGKKDPQAEKEDLTKVLTYLTFLQKQEYLTSSFIDKLAGIKRLLQKKGVDKIEIHNIIQSIMNQFQSNIDSLASGLTSENRKQSIYWIFNFLINTDESVQREALERAEKYVLKAIAELD